MKRCTIPAVYVTGRYGSWSCCGCGWISPLVHDGAIGATVAWALHFAAAESDPDSEAVLGTTRWWGGETFMRPEGYRSDHAPEPGELARRPRRTP